jgi:hypothetical protein
MVLQMAENPDVTATIVYFELAETFTPETTISTRSPTGLSFGKGSKITEQHTPGERDAVFFASLKNSIPAELAARVLLETVNAGSTPVAAAIDRARLEIGQAPRNAGDLVVMGRNTSHAVAFAKESPSSIDDAGKCLGILGKEVLKSNFRASVIIVQAVNGTV